MFESWYKWIKRSVLEGNFTKDLSILHNKDINVFIIIIISIVWQDREKYFKWVFYSRISFFFPIFKLFHGFCYNKNLSDISFCPANIYLFKVKNRNNRKRWEICSKLTTKTLERQHWGRPGVFIVNFKHISNLFLGLLLWLWASKWWLLIPLRLVLLSSKNQSCDLHCKTIDWFL